MALHLKSTGIDYADFGHGTGTMASELLDDYEEGSWTPTAATGFSTLTVAFASYDKVGRIVRWAFYIYGIGSGTSSGMAIGGTPFTPSDTYTVSMPINSSTQNATQYNPHFRLSTNGNLYAIKNNDDSLAGQDLDASHIITAGVYRAA